MKRWQISAVLVAVFIVVVAAVVGTVLALTLSGDSSSAPSGKHTVLRVQSDSKATCGGIVVASIYLDDLQNRPSPYDDKHASGLVSFELPLTYDPKVLQIGDPSNVVLNDELDREDDDGDGVVRNWIPVSYINDREGWAMVAGSSYNPNSGGDDKLNHEEGLVPSQSGVPILLATVHFSVIGEGDSSINIEAGPGGAFQRDVITLYDPDVKRYENVEVKAAQVEASGGDCSEVMTSTPIPTRAPAPTDVPLATPTVPVWNTVEAPKATVVGRADCPANWVAYTDGEKRFSICYPAGYNATASDFAVNIHSPRTANELNDLIAVAVSWNSTPGTIYYPPNAANCDRNAVMGQTTTVFVELTVSGRRVPACFSQGRLEGATGVPIGAVQGALPLASDGSDTEGFIQFAVNFTGSDVTVIPAAAQAVLDTLKVKFREPQHAP
jgi:hypothetical protein